MKGWRIRSGTIVLAGMLAEQGCLFKRKPPKASIVIPPAPQAQPPQPLPTPPQLAAPQANSDGAARPIGAWKIGWQSDTSAVMRFFRANFSSFGRVGAGRA